MNQELGLERPQRNSAAIAAAACDLRLAAIDLDGTLLGPELTISPENRRAVAKLQAAGLEVVLASGRHHDSMKPFARELPGVRWIVSTQGAEVSDLGRSTVLRQAFLSHERVAAVRAVQQQLGIVAVFYTHDAVLTETPVSEDIDFYARLSGLQPERVSAARLAQASIYKAVWIAAPAVIDAVATDRRLGALDVQTVRTHLRLIEFMPTDVTKATGLAALTQHLGLTAAGVVAFGDAENDIPMFEWAAASFAMAHGWPAAKQRARRIAPAGPVESAFARAVDVLM